MVYERVLRYATWYWLRITLPPPRTGDTVDVDIARNYLDAFELSSIVPEPEEVSADRDDLRFTLGTSSGAKAWMYASICAQWNGAG